jgi:hypothetical protein
MVTQHGAQAVVSSPAPTLLGMDDPPHYAAAFTAQRGRCFRFVAEDPRLRAATFMRTRSGRQMRGGNHARTHQGIRSRRGAAPLAAARSTSAEPALEVSIRQATERSLAREHPLTPLGCGWRRRPLATRNVPRNVVRTRPSHVLMNAGAKCRRYDARRLQPARLPSRVSLTCMLSFQPLPSSVANRRPRTAWRRPEGRRPEDRETGRACPRRPPDASLVNAQVKTSPRRTPIRAPARYPARHG